MKILFNWCQSFSDNSEWHNDEEILSLESLQKEGSFATAKVSLKNKIIKHKYARIGVEIDEKIQLIFCGKVISFPMNLENSIMQIELLSEPDNYQTQLKTFSNLRWEKYKKIDFEKCSMIYFFRNMKKKIRQFF